jgi:hypothetical protein
VLFATKHNTRQTNVNDTGYLFVLQPLFSVEAVTVTWVKHEAISQECNFFEKKDGAKHTRRTGCMCNLNSFFAEFSDPSDSRERQAKFVGCND